jgi:alcohol dehydrogenase YqhD (iron-dependent ADH family)
MLNFEFEFPTKLIFGKGSVDKVGKEVAKYGKKVLIHHDGGDYLKELLGKVKGLLEAEGLTVLELGGVVPNPRYSLIQKGVELCRKENVDFVLAIGGGSVMDSSKSIAFFTKNDGELADFAHYKKMSPDCLPLGTVVTMPGTGSEISNNAMVVDDRTERLIKYPLFQNSFRFKFAVMDPELTYSLPMKQTVSGTFDIISHTMERYFNGENHVNLSNRLCEANLLTIMDEVRKVIKDPRNYEARANLFLAAMLGNSPIIEMGAASDWAVHNIENPVTTTFQQTHGSTLAIITPAWMKYVYKRDLPKYAEFATRVMGVPADFYDLETTALRGIEALEQFIKEIGLPTRLSDIGVTEDSFEALADHATLDIGVERIGMVSQLTRDEVVEIYKLAK